MSKLYFNQLANRN